MATRSLTLGVSAFALTALAGAAEAGLEFCNETDVFQSIAVGYMGDRDWTSEGWWLVEPGACVTPVEGDLQSRYYYYRAESDEGSFEGDGYGFCVASEAFTIVGLGDCEARGYETSDFREIDTGAEALHYTVTLGDGTASPETLPVPDTAPEPEADAPGDAPETGVEDLPEAPEEIPEPPEAPTEEVPEFDAPGDGEHQNPRAGASRF